MQLPAPSSPPLLVPDAEPLLVACLCAQWCGTCRDYRATFEQIESRFPSLKFLWIDVEDDADLVDPVDVVDFPTLLLAHKGQPVFFGPLTPQPETLFRLLQAHGEPALQARAEHPPEVHELLQNITGRRTG